MVKATTKRERKYGKKERDVLTPQTTRVPRKKPENKKRFKILIDKSNFHGEIFKSYGAAQDWIKEQREKLHSNCDFYIMEA